MSMISRSRGVASGVADLLVGSGETGIAPDLDAEVQRAAELLRDAYGIDVMIRFNSDRMSGGAWLVTDEVDGIGANEAIGLTVDLRDVARLKLSHETYRPEGDDGFAQQLTREGQDPANPPARYLVRSVFIDEAAASDPGILNAGNPDNRYIGIFVATLEEGIEVLARHANVPGTPPTAPGL